MILLRSRLSSFFSHSLSICLCFLLIMVESGIQSACRADSPPSPSWGLLRLLILLSFFTEICASFLLMFFGVYSVSVVLVVVAV